MEFNKVNKMSKKQGALLLVVFIFLAFLYTQGYNKGTFTSKIYMQNQMQQVQLPGGITSDRSIEQEITIPENYSSSFIDLNIFFATYQRVNHSELLISLTQNNISELIHLDAVPLKDNSYAEVRFKNSGFKSGPATLKITSNTTDTAKTLTVALTKDISQGEASVDGTRQNGYGLLHQEIYPVKNLNGVYFILFLLFFFFSVLKILDIQYRRINYYICMSVIGTVTMIMCFFPSASVAAENYAEAATNYFMAAYEKGWIESLKQLDAGYLPLLPRIISLILVKILHVGTSFAIITQWIAIILLALFTSLFNLKTFRQLIPSDFIRFIVGFVIGTGLFHDYELFMFINFSYLALVPCLLVMFFNLENMKKWKIVLLAIVGFLLVSSKAYFITFFPFYGLLFLYYFFKKKYKSAIFYGVATISMCIQIIVVISNRSTWTTQSVGENVDTSLSHMIFQLISLYIHNVYWYFFEVSNSMTSGFGKFMVMVFLVLISLAIIYFVRKNGNKKIFAFILVTQLLAIMALTLSLSVPYVKEMSVWSPGFEIPYNRHFIFSNVLIFLGVLVAFIHTFKSRKVQFVMVSIFLAIYILNGYKGTDFYPYENMSYSQWQENFSAFEQRGCVPVNPNPWMICKEGTKYFAPVAVVDEDPVLSVDVAESNPESLNWKETGLVLDKKNPWNQKLKLVLYNQNFKKIGESVETSNPTYRYGYFKFDKELNVSRVEFYTERGQPVSLTNPILTFFGTP